MKELEEPNVSCVIMVLLVGSEVLSDIGFSVVVGDLAMVKRGVSLPGTYVVGEAVFNAFVIAGVLRVLTAFCDVAGVLIFLCNVTEEQVEISGSERLQ